MIGCERAGILHTFRSPRAWAGAVAELVVLDRTGRPLTRRRISPELDRVRPSALGGTPVDVTFADCFDPADRAPLDLGGC